MGVFSCVNVCAFLMPTEVRRGYWIRCKLTHCHMGVENRIWSFCKNKCSSLLQFIIWIENLLVKSQKMVPIYLL